MGILAQLMKYTAVVLLMLPMLAGALVVGIFSRPGAHKIMAYWARWATKIFGITVCVESDADEKDLRKGGVMVGLSQQSLIDSVLAYGAINRHYLSIWNIEYALIPLIGWMAWVLGWVIIRQWPAQAHTQLQKAAAYVANGGLVYISAEGRRSETGALNPYKKGPAVFSINSQSRIFPVYVFGSYRCMPYGSWKIRPGVVTIRILQPLTVQGMTYADRNDLTAKLRELGEREQQLADAATLS